MSLNFPKPLTVIALSLAMISGPAFAAKETFDRVKPHVSVGTSTSGIAVKLKSPEGTQQTTTDEGGEFWFMDVRPGTHTIKVGPFELKGAGDTADGNVSPPEPFSFTIHLSQSSSGKTVEPEMISMDLNAIPKRNRKPWISIKLEVSESREGTVAKIKNVSSPYEIPTPRGATSAGTIKLKNGTGKVGGFLDIKEISGETE